MAKWKQKWVFVCSSVRWSLLVSTDYMEDKVWSLVRLVFKSLSKYLSICIVLLNTFQTSFLRWHLLQNADRCYKHSADNKNIYSSGFHRKKGFKNVMPTKSTLYRPISIHSIKSNMDQIYLDNVKSTNSNKKWVHITIRSGSLHTLEHKEAVAKLGIFNGHDCLMHHLKRMNLIDSVICRIITKFQLG